MVYRIPAEYGSKFRFCVVAGQRARQIQGGASSKLEIGVNKPAYIALKEAEANLIRWEILLDEDATPDEEGSE